jgi:hypothetical protein
MPTCRFGGILSLAERQHKKRVDPKMQTERPEKRAKTVRKKLEAWHMCAQCGETCGDEYPYEAGLNIFFCSPSCGQCNFRYPVIRFMFDEPPRKLIDALAHKFSLCSVNITMISFLNGLRASKELRTVSAVAKLIYPNDACAPQKFCKVVEDFEWYNEKIPPVLPSSTARLSPNRKDVRSIFSETNVVDEVNLFDHVYTMPAEYVIRVLNDL